ncbi:FkbM family methyltransferase [Mesorhizobium marinum]|uniref:FkbM family methyltransferase n=1 Tax=Mesorhizobium marinum TaxID=3228790 RepID=UPI00346697C2
MTIAVAADIVIDARSGRVEGASAGERVAITVLRSAMFFLKPFANVGISYVARAMRALLPSDRPMLFVLTPDSSMRVAYCDTYWSVLVSPNYAYERSVKALLKASRDVDYGFIDGGANHGYWSILVSGGEFGAKKAVAIEAASDTFCRLDDNRSLNEGRFSVLNRAIGATSGQRVRVYGAKHEARSTVAPSVDAVPILDCETISVDDLADLPEFAGLDKFVVKLDVEGVEIAAFSGAQRLLSGDTVFVYEEHGSDTRHETTRHVMDVMKLRVFWLGDGRARELSTADELDRIKKSRRAGYDMVASSSRFWLDRLDASASTVH